MYQDWIANETAHYGSSFSTITSSADFSQRWDEEELTTLADWPHGQSDGHDDDVKVNGQLSYDSNDLKNLKEETFSNGWDSICDNSLYELTSMINGNQAMSLEKQVGLNSNKK